MKELAKNKKIIIFGFIILIMLGIQLIPNYTYATIEANDYKPGAIQTTYVSHVKKIANPIIGAVKTIGIVVAVIALGIIGIKYMTASVNEKAEYKKTMIPYLIGAILVVAITQLLSVVIKIIINVK